MTSTSEVLRLNEKEPYAYQFYASILKNQDKIDEMINLIEEGLSKNLMNPKWKYQKLQESRPSQ